jgi:tripartite-type tricarboxylate transporter receptor subunit TctC
MRLYANSSRAVVALQHAYGGDRGAQTPDVKQRYGQIGSDIIGDTPEQFASTLKSEGEIFGAVIRKAGIETN